MSSIPLPPGVFDILPACKEEPWRASFLWSHLEQIIRETAQDFGYHEIRTPMFERTELFQRTSGETSAIVSKEMYTFEDKGKRSMSLRPEGTAPVIRAFIENNLQNDAPIHKLFYIGPMFRYDRPQAGRYRQHHQFGAEAIGNTSPEQDAEIIDMIHTLYTRLGLKNLKIYLNSLGDPESRQNFKQALIDYFTPFLKDLSQESQIRLTINPLRILDSKDPADKKVAEGAPSILNYLSEPSKVHFETVKKLLTALNIPYEINSNLVRGLDYYNHTVFEVVSEDLKGSQNSIGGGGRYDGLIKMLGGPDLPSIGFGTGLERVLQTMLKQEVSLPKHPRPKIFLIPLGEAAKNYCFNLLHDLRQCGVPAQMDFSGRKLPKLMQYANTISAEYVAVIGDNELKTGEGVIKNMDLGTETKVPLKTLGKIFNLEEKSIQYLKVAKEMSKPLEDPSEGVLIMQHLTESLGSTCTLTEEIHKKMGDMKTLLSKHK